MKITLEYLDNYGACAEAQSLFNILFPDGVEPTEALAEKHALDFDWYWAGVNLLTDEGIQRFKESAEQIWRDSGTHKSEIQEAFYKLWSLYASPAFRETPTHLETRNLHTRLLELCTHRAFRDRAKLFVELFKDHHLPPGEPT